MQYLVVCCRYFFFFFCFSLRVVACLQEIFAANKIRLNVPGFVAINAPYLESLMMSELLAQLWSSQSFDCFRRNKCRWRLNGLNAGITHGGFTCFSSLRRCKAGGGGELSAPTAAKAALALGKLKGSLPNFNLSARRLASLR